MTEDKMVGWHHPLDGHESEQAPGAGDGRGSLVAAVHGVTKSRTRLSVIHRRKETDVVPLKPTCVLTAGPFPVDWSPVCRASEEDSKVGGLSEARNLGVFALLYSTKPHSVNSNSQLRTVPPLKPWVWSAASWHQFPPMGPTFWPRCSRKLQVPPGSLR